jgi:hypothetical protein
MKSNLFFLINLVFLLLIFESMNAQQVISSTGGTGQNANGTLTYTLGELVIDTRTSGSTTITQGFQQSRLTVTSVKELQDLGFTIAAFPNPTSNFITIKVEKGKPEKITYSLIDVSGKPLHNGKLLNGEAEISFISLNPATYILKIFQDGKEIKTVKIVKQ